MAQHPPRLRPGLGPRRILDPIQQHEPPQTREAVVRDPCAERHEAVGAVGLEHHREQARGLARHLQIAGPTVVCVVPKPPTPSGEGDRPLALPGLDQDAEAVLWNALLRGTKVGAPRSDGGRQALAPRRRDARPSPWHAGGEGRRADLEPEPDVLVPRAGGSLERLDRQVHVPHTVGYLAKAEPGRGRGRAPSRRLVGAQRFVELAEGFRGFSQRELRRGRVRSKPCGGAGIRNLLYIAKNRVIRALRGGGGATPVPGITPNESVP